MKISIKLLSLIFLLPITLNCLSQNQTRDLVIEQKIENQLYQIDSSMVGLFREATVAMDQNNLKVADSLYSIIYKRVPDFDPLLRRLGAIRMEAGKIDEGIELCQKAVDINRSAYNLLSLSYCLIQPGEYNDVDKALSLLEEAKTLPDGDDVDIISLIGQLQLQKDDLSEFRNTVVTMNEKYPDIMMTHYFNAIISAQDKKWTRAKKEILIAKELGLPDDLVEEFLDSGVQYQNTIRTFSFTFLWIFMFWAVGLILLYILGKILSKIVLEASNDQDRISNISGSVRSTYKWLINISGVYYYLSLPIILVLIVALVIGLFYLFLSLGHMPIKLMLVLLIGAVVTIYSMVRSLLLKTKSADPGRELKKEEAPGLFDLIKEVAHSLKTRPIDEIRITYGTDLAVYENGTWRQKQQDKAKRILILGAAVIGDFNKNDFRAVLAHEYGHFSHRDTAGGDVALKMKDDMTKYLYSLYYAEQNVWWNIAFQFLRLYSFIFRRISFGSTRLQEMLADKVAVQHYGAVAFKNGLTYVIKRDIDFADLLNKNVEEIRNARPSINIYDISGSRNQNLEELDKALNTKTSEDDTHPSPNDRFRFISKIESPSLIEDPSDIKDLFVNWDSIQNEMRSYLDKQIAKNL